ncbi:MAG: hypothetical protein HQ538_02940, partial [Parcubacteria group bacterium]|nr:hypothetical protein [Parcubacteria group bacterium]
IGEVRLYAEQEGLKVKITVADGAKGIDFVKEKVRKEMKKEEGKREWDELEGVDMTVLERYIEDEKLNVSTAGKDEATVVSEIREEEKRQREAFVKKLNDPEFVKSFLHRYIDDKFRGNAVRIKAVKAQVDALNNNQRKEYAKKIV